MKRSTSLLLILLCLGTLICGACLQITPLAQCLEPSDCELQKGEKCDKGICVGPVIPQPPPPSCPQTCKSHTDCQKATCTGNVCLNDRCIGPRTHTLNASQAVVKAMDILFVVDNSGSMKEEQEKLARNFVKFIEVLTKFDIGNYQIGIITTDMDNPLERGKLQSKQGLPKIISRANLSAPQVIDAFQRNINIGIRGTSFEKALDAMRAALSPNLLNDPNGNKGFLRDGALLSIIFVGDEDDCSHDGSIPETELDSSVCRLPKSETLLDDQGKPIPDAKGNPVKGRMESLTPTSVYIDFLKGLNRQVFVSGLIGDPVVYKSGQQMTPIDPVGGCEENKACQDSSNGGRKCVFQAPNVRACGGCTSLFEPPNTKPDADAVPGFRLFDVIKAFGGAREWAPICGNDSVYQDTLLRTARSLVERLHTVRLSPAPVPGTSALFVVEIIASNGAATRVDPAKATGQACSHGSDCSGGGACSTDNKCYSDGWVFVPASGSVAAGLLLSGNARTRFAPGTTLRVKYPIAP